MASFEVQLLSQCISMVHELATLEQCASITVKIGSEFNFEFCNKEASSKLGRKLSPSQLNRNRMRRQEYLINKLGTVSKIEEDPSHGSLKQNGELDMVNSVMINTNEVETQTDVVELTHFGVNTEIMESVSAEVAHVGVNTEIQKHDSLLEVDENGVIHPRDHNEKIVEMKINHDFKSWEEVQVFIKENLKMDIIGRPWLSNSGRLYKTVGFRTLSDDYERWKLEKFNWQDSGIRAVSSSRLYR